MFVPSEKPKLYINAGKFDSSNKTIPMKINYLDDFPIPKDLLPMKLFQLLEPVSLSRKQRVEVSARYQKNDLNNPDYECLHMLMAVIPEGEEDEVGVLKEADNGVVSYSVPWDDEKGCCADYQKSVSGYDYIVASRGDGSFYSYVLAEKVWMMLGLTPRCFGSDSQRIVFDDLSLPEFAVAEGEASNEFYFKPDRNVSWKMSNEYLRKYLWMQDSYAARVFFYEALLSETTKLREIMNDKSHVVLNRMMAGTSWISENIKTVCSYSAGPPWWQLHLNFARIRQLRILNGLMAMDQ